jgi:hypothetical protein
VTDDLRQRYAEEMSRHHLVDGVTDADDNTLCVCGQWADAEDESWDDHMAEVCAAVRDEEMAALRQEVEQLRVAASPLKAAAAGRLVASATSLVRIERNDARQRADRAEAHALRLRQAVTILRAALRHDTPCNGPSPDVDPCGACVAIEYLAGAALDEPEIEGEPQETRNPGERPSERLPGPLHSPTGPRKDSLPEAALDEPEAHHE